VGDEVAVPVRRITRGQKFDLRRAREGHGLGEGLPKVAAGWTQIRDMPAPAARTFHEMWRKRKLTLSRENTAMSDRGA
jgi:hypothetical protein